MGEVLSVYTMCPPNEHIKKIEIHRSTEYIYMAGGGGPIARVHVGYAHARRTTHQSIRSNSGFKLRLMLTDMDDILIALLDILLRLI